MIKKIPIYIEFRGCFFKWLDFGYVPLEDTHNH